MTKRRRRVRRARGGATMLCPACETPTRVGRTTREKQVVTRQRYCRACGRSIITEERVLPARKRRK